MAQTVCIILRAAERERLAAIVSDRNRQRKHIERAPVILASAEVGPVQHIATRPRVSPRWSGAGGSDLPSRGVDELLRDKIRKPGKPPIPAETVQRAWR